MTAAEARRLGLTTREQAIVGKVEAGKVVAASQAELVALIAKLIGAK